MPSVTKLEDHIVGSDHLDIRQSKSQELIIFYSFSVFYSIKYRKRKLEFTFPYIFNINIYYFLLWVPFQQYP